MSSHSVVSLSSFNILFFTQVLTVLTSSIKYHEYVTDKGKNISIPCTAEGNVMWVKEGGNNSTIIQTGKFLVLTNVSTDERGLYVCFAAVPPRQSSAPITGSNAQATNEQRKSITASLPTSASPSTASSLILTSTSSSSTLSSLEDINVSTMMHTSATNASTTSSLPMPVPTIAVATATNANANTVNISTGQQVSKSDKATTLNNSGQTMEAPIPDAERKTEANNGDKSEEETEAEEYQAVEKVNLTVRTPPGPVTQLYFKASTILGFLIWRFNKTNSGGYPVRSFTAEFRNVSYNETPYNQSFEHEWSRMDPINIAPNVRQMEVYRLEPNTTYEFRIWANNQLGSGEVVTTNVTTLPETKEEDLIRLIQPDLDNFDPRIWIIAVSVVLGTLVILAIGLCIVLSKECYQSSQTDFENGWESIELIPNIILNPGFCESDGSEPVQPYTRTIIFGEDDESDGYESEESDHEPPMEKFKRKVSVFFTGPTIRRI
ncbi:A-agglutinin anchorage subunit isoform X1 [Bactrocera tryoni]|uniref:A-agglutinin anchorage subunit isoform X1 n=1 Tax=Bactrocera tryoni TaxID=59916 RepID=UPI001A98655B|nr:A-agglutinin anchorage subunit isoform X1 [Bactrocera tryoni]